MNGKVGRNDTQKYLWRGTPWPGKKQCAEPSKNVSRRCMRKISCTETFSLFLALISPQYMSVCCFAIESLYEIKTPLPSFCFYWAQLVSVRDVHKHTILLPHRFNPFKRTCWKPDFNVLYFQGAAEVCGLVVVNSWLCTSRKKILSLVNISIFIHYIIRRYI